MENPRPEKVAAVAELEAKFDAADAVLLTEYRGLNVPALAELRRELRAAGGEYKIYKNTLVRIAAQNAGINLDALLTGPTAIAFVGDKADGSAGDAAAAAKALRDFAKKNDALVLKGGLVDGAPIDTAQLIALADLPSRDVLLSMFAGALAAPMTKFAGLLEAMPRNLAYGIKALIDTMPAEAPAVAPEPAEAPAADAPADEASDDQTAADEAPSQESEAPVAEDAIETPAAEATTETPAEAGSEQES